MTLTKLQVIMFSPKSLWVLRSQFPKMSVIWKGDYLGSRSFLVEGLGQHNQRKFITLKLEGSSTLCLDFWNESEQCNMDSKK